MDVLSNKVSRRRARGRGERGAVTAELAMVLPLVLGLVVAGVWSIAVIVDNIRCIDAARDVARAVARGESPEAAEAIGRRTAPPGATIDVRRNGSDIRVTVTVTPHREPPLLAGVPVAPITAEATLELEPGSPITEPSAQAGGRP